MAMPPRTYDKTTSFNDYATNNPSGPLPGAQLDVEFANIENALDDLEAARALIQRSDGALKNGIVTKDTLAAGLVDELTSGVEASVTDTANAALSTANAADDKADTALAHLSRADNPHGVTAAQVGNGIAQWNADKVVGISFRAPQAGELVQGAFWAYDGVLGQMTLASSSGIIALIQQDVEDGAITNVTTAMQPLVDDAAASASAAQASADATTVQAGIASGAAGTATAQANISTTQAGIATTQAGSAFASALAASGSADAAAQDATDAQAYSDQAHAWAETAEDVEVAPGQFSALHWAAKAQEAMSTSQLGAHGFKHNGHALEWTHGVDPFDASAQDEWGVLPNTAVFSINASGHLEVTF